MKKLIENLNSPVTYMGSLKWCAVWLAIYFIVYIIYALSNKIYLVKSWFRDLKTTVSGIEMRCKKL